MTAPPSGTVTFLFTDVEQSTRLVAELGADAYGQALEEHRKRLREAFQAGYEVDTQGDSLFYAFDRADDAVLAAAAGQRALDELPLQVRMGLHTGEPAIVGDRYVGLDVHRAARICAAAHGGQIVLSQTTRDLADVETRDLGEHRLKDLAQPQRLHQLLAPGLRTEFAPLRTLETRRTNLPLQTTPLVGRITELDELRTLLADEDVRLVTLTGPGGSGKTRLALHAAAEAVDLFPNGAWFVSLEAIREAALLLPTIAQTIGLVESGNRALEETVREYLAGRRVLLVLDNFEQLLDAARTVGDLLDGSPGVRVLATSRARLRIAAEHAFPVLPLALPDPRSLPAIDALSRYEAVALFLERSRSVAPGFDITEENAPAIAKLCVRLDGLPLAIELAAARVKLLPPQALLARLGQRLDLLRSGARDRPERQQTLRATLNWSFDLLNADERRLFASLSVFAGGFRLDAAEAVCDADLDRVEVLLENSLLRSEERSDGEPRFFMLETIRDYGREQLDEEGVADDLRERHARWYAEWLERRTKERLAARLTGDWEPEDEEQDNIRAALAWARDRGQVGLELQFAASAGLFYWPNRGHLTEGRRWLDDVLGRSHDADQGLRARALVAAAQLAWRQRDYDGCEELAAEAQIVLERLDDRPPLALALMARGIAADARGDGDAAERHYDRAERIFRELGHTEALNAILNNRAYADIVSGHFESAERRLREVAQTAGGDVGPFAVANHGLALALLGRLDEAESRFDAILHEAVAAGRPTEALLYAFEGLALVAASRAEDPRAAELWGVSSALREATGYVLATAEQRFHDQLVPEVRGRLGDAGFDLAWDVGRQLSFEQATALALRRVANSA
jgi:predicted ATPase/class 3 adenylate cyclase/Flp pilus assembly protein TadD